MSFSFNWPFSVPAIYNGEENPTVKERQKGLSVDHRILQSRVKWIAVSTLIVLAGVFIIGKQTPIGKKLILRMNQLSQKMQAVCVLAFFSLYALGMRLAYGTEYRKALWLASLNGLVESLQQGSVYAAPPAAIEDTRKEGAKIGFYFGCKINEYARRRKFFGYSKVWNGPFRSGDENAPEDNSISARFDRLSRVLGF